jgi:hypothetical protein
VWCSAGHGLDSHAGEAGYHSESDPGSSSSTGGESGWEEGENEEEALQQDDEPPNPADVLYFHIRTNFVS